MSTERSVAWQNYADNAGISPHSEPERGVFEDAWDAAHAALPTPTTSRVKTAYEVGNHELTNEQEERRGEAFDRWLAAHDAEVARQQADRDASLADAEAMRWVPDQRESDYAAGRQHSAHAVAAAIRAEMGGVK